MVRNIEAKDVPSDLVALAILFLAALKLNKCRTLHYCLAKFCTFILPYIV